MRDPQHDHHIILDLEDDPPIAHPNPPARTRPQRPRATRWIRTEGLEPSVNPLLDWWIEASILAERPRNQNDAH